MEAVGEYNFSATDLDDELSFSKGQIITVLDKDEDPNWYRAEVDGCEGYVPKNYVRMLAHGWFRSGECAADMARLREPKTEEGAFFVRPSNSSMLVRAMVNRPDLTRPRWRQDSFVGRARHFFAITNPANLLIAESKLLDYRSLVDDFQRGTIREGLTAGELWRAKHAVDSAFHPVSGDMMWAPGRMCAQVPSNMLLIGGMLSFYRSPAAVVFWQWLNQSFNATVNYTNRSAADEVPLSSLASTYCLATGGAVSAALLFRALSPPGGLLARLVPFAAVCTANAINIPMMRWTEISEGLTILDEHGCELGKSPKMAKKAVAQVLASRVAMAAPTLVLIPLLTGWAEKRRWWRAGMTAPWQVALAGVILAMSTPLGCALFPQLSPVHVSELEPELRRSIRETHPHPPRVVFYNKGLVPGDFAISVREDIVQTYRIKRDREGMFRVWDARFPSLNKLVEYYKRHSISRIRDSMLKEAGDGDTTHLTLVQALFDFAAAEPDELPFRAGEVIRVTRRHDSSWWEGVLDGRTGLFPANHVRPFGVPDPGADGRQTV